MKQAADRPGLRLASPLVPPLPKHRGERLRWRQLHGASQGLAVYQAILDHPGPVIVIVPDTQAANHLEDAIRFFGSRMGSSLEGGAEIPLRHFPDWETLPYDTFSPHHDLVSERLATLYQLPGLGKGALIVPVTTLMVRLPPRSYLETYGLLLNLGDRLAIDAMRTRLEAGGYRCVSQVMEHGEFAVRGSLLDLFPMGSALPYRVDLLDEEVDSIRTFDPETQRSTGKVQSIRLLPAREVPLTEEAIARFRQQWRVHFAGDPTGSPLYRDVSQGFSPAGIEYYLPLFFDHTATLFDYLPETALVIIAQGSHGAAETFWKEIGDRYAQRCHDRERPILPPPLVFLQPPEVFGALSRFPQVILELAEQESSQAGHTFATSPPPSLPIDARAPQPLARLAEFLDDFPGRVLVVAETAGRREALLAIFQSYGLEPALFATWRDFQAQDAPLGITVSPLENGTILENPPLAVIAEAQLFGERARQRSRPGRGRDSESIVRDLTELSIGAPVVHEEHGVGRYQGLQTLTIGDLTNEFLVLEYAGGDRLYVPVSSLHLIARYSGLEAEHAPLHRLGSQQWQKARKKAAERAYDVAAELLEIHARRAASTGYSFQWDEVSYRNFVEGFPFEETPDQQRAIDETLADMKAPRPMDRLICGDVGFGKTEVAMRAAFVAVQNGRQVALLVPTTLLVQQHYQTLCDRFAGLPVRIEQLSRFRSRKEQDHVQRDLAEGKVDIVIGTHKLLQKEVRFQRLGLVIIDEEHRFGVRQKEQLKALRAEVDLLTLTATPIPRTLNMALAGLRDLSLIATPPERRLSIKTFVREWDDGLLREACLREIRRGGQVYFVHNRVEDIEKIAQRVQELVPEATLRIAHGQMRERDLERAMLDFYHQRFNLLVCTTIIESGIDIPSANTILIHRADHFGLAQLHQLRGRVGRSHHRAYAYLLVPPRTAMTADAVKRLEAVESLEDLGVGFSLATHDLEIRGAGELLGENQSGQIHEVGYALYTELLERAVKALRAGQAPELDRPLDHGAEVDLHVVALIPEDYLPDIHTRLILYKRIASATHLEALRDLQVEMIDRFGLLPPPVQALFRLAEIKLKANPLGVRKVDLGERGGHLLFYPQASVDPARIVRLLQQQPQVYRLEGGERLGIATALPEAASRFRFLEALLDTLQPEMRK